MDEENQESKPVKIIKRYQNRKLYDTERSCYVTLNEIAELIKNGEEVRVVDNRTKRDLTSLTLAQIIFEEEKKRKRLLPLGLLRNIIQSSSTPIVDLWKKSVSTSVSSLEDVESFFQKLIAKGAISKEDGQQALQNIVTFTQRSFEDAQKRLDEGVKDALGRVMPGRNLREEFSAMQRKLDDLEAKLRELER